MRILLSLLVVVFFAVLSAAEPAERTATVNIWPLGAPTPEPYAQIVYNTKASTGSYRILESPTRNLDRNTLLRIGWHDKATAQWKGIVRTAEHVLENPDVTLFVDGTGNAWNLDLAKGPKATKGEVRIKKAALGVVPALNRPVVLNAEGKIPVPEVEKSFLQKYWWILLGGAVLILGSAAGPEE